MSRVTKSDIENLSWIWQRLVNHHGENQNMDYMHKLNGIIINLKLDCAYDEMEDETMEKQPTEYEYVKVSHELCSRVLIDFEQGDKLFHFSSGEYRPIATEKQAALMWSNDNVYRRIELTPEQLHERKVEELARYMRDNNPRKGDTDWDGVANPVKEEYLRGAKLALEWMESKGK